MSTPLEQFHSPPSPSPPTLTPPSSPSAFLSSSSSSSPPSPTLLLKSDHTLSPPSSPSLFASFYRAFATTPKPPSSPRSIAKSVWKNYAASQGLALFAAGACTLISYVASKFKYRVAHPTPSLFFDSLTFTRLFVIFCVFGLLLFASFQYYVFNGKRELAEPRFLFLAFIGISIIIALPIGMHRISFPYYYYHIDILIIIGVFCGMCFMIGYFAKEERKSRNTSMEKVPSASSSSSKISPIPLLPIKEAFSDSFVSTPSESTSFTQRQRVINGLFLMTVEGLVSLTALIYGMFFVMLYASLNDFMKMVWRLLVHPLYFEVFMMIPVRYLVARKLKGYTTINVMYTLAVVHAQSHISTLGRMMFSTLDSIAFTVLSVALLNVGKFFFRLSSPLRDMIIYKILNLGNIKQENTEEQLYRQRYIISCGMQTEIIVENACAIFSGFTMWFFQKDKYLFMFPYPTGYLSIDTVLFVTLIQIVFALIFDIATLYVAQVYLHLPVLETWSAMWHKKYRYFGFLLYGLFTMGLLGIFYMGFRVPRITFCSSNDVCSCVWLAWANKDCDTFISLVAL